MGRGYRKHQGDQGSNIASKKTRRVARKKRVRKKQGVWKMGKKKKGVCRHSQRYQKVEKVMN